MPIEDETVHAQLSQGMGSLVLDFDNFRYFTYSDRVNGILADYSEGTVSYNIPQKTYVAFGIYLTNEDPKKRTITLDSHSLFWQSAQPAVPANRWYIVNVDAEGAIMGTYSPIIIEYGASIMLVFASGKDLGAGQGFTAEDTEGLATVATFLLLHGTLGSGSFAQNIPYVSLFYES